MIVRKLTAADLDAARRVGATSFHGAVRPQAPDAKPPEIQEQREIRWGAFSDAGEIMGVVVDNILPMRFDGHETLMSGIGGVATLPEFRYGNCIREIFRTMLQEQYGRGVLFSTLFPFSHIFYRKFGYELSRHTYSYRFSVKSLRGLGFDGWAKTWKPEDDPTPYTALYNDFAARYNLSLVRDNDRMAGHFNGDPLAARINDRHATRRFAYLLGRGDQTLSYVIFDDVWQPDMPLLRVHETAWRDREGFAAILGFLARFSADYGDIVMDAPCDVDISALVIDPYAVKMETGNCFMARAVNAEQALALAKKPADTRFVIAVDDPFLPQNTGSYLVTGKTAVRTEAAPDLRVGAQTLGPLLLGFLDLDTALLRPDVELYHEVEGLRQVFPHKPLYVNDAY